MIPAVKPSFFENSSNAMIKTKMFRTINAKTEKCYLDLSVFTGKFCSSLSCFQIKNHRKKNLKRFHLEFTLSLLKKVFSKL